MTTMQIVEGSDEAFRTACFEAVACFSKANPGLNTHLQLAVVMTHLTDLAWSIARHAEPRKPGQSREDAFKSLLQSFADMVIQEEHIVSEQTVTTAGRA